jgi:hypothetical protein
VGPIYAYIHRTLFIDLIFQILILHDVDLLCRTVRWFRTEHLLHGTLNRIPRAQVRGKRGKGCAERCIVTIRMSTAGHGCMCVTWLERAKSTIGSVYFFWRVPESEVDEYSNDRRKDLRLFLFRAMSGRSSLLPTCCIWSQSVYQGGRITVHSRIFINHLTAHSQPLCLKPPFSSSAQHTSPTPRPNKRFLSIHIQPSAYQLDLARLPP